MTPIEYVGLQFCGGLQAALGPVHQGKIDAEPRINDEPRHGRPSEHSTYNTALVDNRHRYVHVCGGVGPANGKEDEPKDRKQNNGSSMEHGLLVQHSMRHRIICIYDHRLIYSPPPYASTVAGEITAERAEPVA